MNKIYLLIFLSSLPPLWFGLIDLYEGNSFWESFKKRVFCMSIPMLLIGLAALWGDGYFSK